MPLTGEQAKQVDALVPPPWSTGRRLAFAALAVAIAGLLFTAWWAGLLGPRLVHGEGGGGGELHVPPGEPMTARREVVVRNAGRLPVEVRAFDPPPLEGVAWLPTEPDLPMTLAPGESVEVWVGFTAADCEVEGGGLDAYPFVARSGPLSARTVGVPLGRQILERSVTTADEGPSWVHDALAIECEVGSPPP